jgi:AraC family transcriptional regulator of arabinose operon
VHLVLSGSGNLIVNGKKYTVHKNEVFFLDNQATFAYYPVADDPWEYIFFEVVGKFVPEYIATTGLSIKNPIKYCPYAQRVTSSLKSAFSKKEENGNISYFETVSLFFLLLGALTNEESSHDFFHQNSFVEEVKSFIQMKYLSPEFNVEYLCNSMHISHSHLCRIFKQKEKISIINYINQLKMTRAKELLLTTNFTITDVAYMSGYKEYEYFLRLFKRMHGVSPTEYRKNNQA